MKPSAPRRPNYTRTASGHYVSRKSNPLDGERRIRLIAPTRHELEERQELVARWQQERRLGLLSEAQFAKNLRGLERREPAKVRACWDRHFETCAPHHRRKLASVWRHQLAPWFDGELVVDLSAAKMARWDRELAAAGYAPKTAHDAFHHLAGALRAAIPELLEEIPWRLTNGKMWKPSRPHKRPQNERPACGTVEQLEALVAAAMLKDRVKRGAGTFSDMAQRIAVVALLALRNGEGSGLGWDDLTLDGDRPRARIRHQAVDQWRTHYPAWRRPLSLPKGNKERTVALHPTAIAALLAQRELLEALGWYAADGPVFPSSRGIFKGDWRPNANCIRPETFKRFALLAGLPDAETWVPHSLRHSATTLESEAGASLKSIQARSGHGSLRVLEEYIHARTGRALVPSAIRTLDIQFGDDGGDDDD